MGKKGSIVREVEVKTVDDLYKEKRGQIFVKTPSAEEDLKKANNKVKLTKDEATAYINAHIEDEAQWLLAKLYPVKIEDLVDRIEVAPESPVEGPGAKPTLREPTDADLTELAERIHRNLIKNWRWDELLLQACRTVKCDLPYVESIVRAVNEKLKTRIALGKSFSIYKAPYQIKKGRS